MRTMVSREARIIDEYRPFLDTIGIYQDALSFLIDVADEHYGEIRNLASQKAMTAVERMVHSTSSRKAIHRHSTSDSRSSPHISAGLPYSKLSLL